MPTPLAPPRPASPLAPPSLILPHPILLPRPAMFCCTPSAPLAPPRPIPPRTVSPVPPRRARPRRQRCRAERVKRETPAADGARCRGGPRRTRLTPRWLAVDEAHGQQGRTTEEVHGGQSNGGRGYGGRGRGERGSQQTRLTTAEVARGGQDPRQTRQRRTRHAANGASE